MRTLSIDPGLTGCICVHDSLSKTIDVFDMPTNKVKIKRKGKEGNRTILDIQGLLTIIKSAKADKAIIEQQAARIHGWATSNI